MTKKWKVSSRVFVSLLAIALVVGMAFMAVAEDSVTTIKLGAINPLADITGAQMSKAMQLAVDEINAAG
jgi:ABC-type branched-subunit amino acid transport system substrate-binding protein